MRVADSGLVYEPGNYWPFALALDSVAEKRKNRRTIGDEPAIWAWKEKHVSVGGSLLCCLPRCELAAWHCAWAWHGNPESRRGAKPNTHDNASLAPFPTVFLAILPNPGYFPLGRSLCWCQSFADTGATGTGGYRMDPEDRASRSVVLRDSKANNLFLGQSFNILGASTCTRGSRLGTWYSLDNDGLVPPASLIASRLPGGPTSYAYLRLHTIHSTLPSLQIVGECEMASCFWMHACQ